jgi:hypothetical protein
MLVARVISSPIRRSAAARPKSSADNLGRE